MHVSTCHVSQAMLLVLKDRLVHIQGEAVLWLG